MKPRLPESASGFNLNGVATLPPACRLAIVLCLLGSILRAAAPDNADALAQLRLVEFTMPEFPGFVRLTGESRGTVTVAIGRNAEGFVTDVLVLGSTEPRLTQSVINAVRQWRFAAPALQAPAGAEIIPIVRFSFSARGIALVSAPTRAPGGANAAAAEAPVILPRFADLDEVPRPLHQPMPKITGRFDARAENGTVTVKFFVDETGRVRVPIVLAAATPDLGQAAVTAVEGWRYEPPRFNRQPTIAIETQTFSFRSP